MPKRGSNECCPRYTEEIAVSCLFNLVGDESGDSDVQCPHCKAKFRVDWDGTEYGDASVGEYAEPCPKCRQEFTFTVNVQYAVLTKSETPIG
jgi:hypothetical protein